MIATDIDLVNKGNLAEVFAGLEVLKYGSCYERQELYYWLRLEKGAQAEVDYVISKSDTIIPIEVKSGTKGSMQSLYIFMALKKTRFGIRTSLENFGNVGNIEIYPLYAIENFSGDIGDAS